MRTERAFWAWLEPVLAAAGGRAWRVEAAGWPDVHWVRPDASAWLELKVVRRGRGGLVRIPWRPGQPARLLALADARGGDAHLDGALVAVERDLLWLPAQACRAAAWAEAVRQPLDCRAPTLAALGAAYLRDPSTAAAIQWLLAVVTPSP